MNGKKELQDVADALGIKSLLPAVYNDLLSPAARELGDGLATIAKAVKIALAPIEATVWGYEKVREWLSLRVTNLLAERKTIEVIAPPLSISGPLTLQIMFASEEKELREMYASLLASAMDKRTAGDAHPSFVTIIQQLTADEARVISHIASVGETWPSWHGKSTGSLGSGNNLWENMDSFFVQAQIERRDNIPVYIENLIRLRLLRHVTGSEPSYHPEGAGDHGDWGPYVTTEYWEFIELTAYGRAFITACVPKYSTQQPAADEQAAAPRPVRQ